MINLLKTLLILPLLITFAGCTPSKDDVVPTVAKNPSILSMDGGIIKVRTTDEFKTLISDEIKLDTGDNVPDNTVFRVVSEDLLVSSDQIDWFKDMLISSVDGKIQFSIKPSTAPGLYRISVFPITSDTIDFQANLSARYFVEVVAGDAFIIQNMTSERFEDLSPYNGVKELNESWIVPANPDLVAYVSVGPIQDKYGNPISEGTIQLAPSQGTVVSNNPSAIAGGYAYFSYKPTSNVADLTMTASYISTPSINLTKSIAMKLAKPDLEFLSAGDFTGMTDGQTKDVSLVLKNMGALPATNLSLNISAPFILLPQQSDSCRDTMTLRSQESCIVRVRYTRNINISQNGYIQAIGQPSTFINSTATLPLVISNSDPARLVLSQSVLNFPQTQCGIKSSLDLFVTNTGSFSATNVNASQPPASVSGEPPYFTIVLPPAGPVGSDPNAIIDCGDTFPAGRKCRVRIEFQPLSLLPPNPVTGYINADSLASLSLSLNGSAIAGQATGDIPVSFLTFGTLLPTTSMFASNGQKTIVRVGPIADSCNNPIANGSVVTASVSGGTLSATSTATNGGYADFTWNSQSKPELFGNQTITLSSNNYSKQAILIFQGVNLVVTGTTDWGQVIVEKPKDLPYQIANTGNVKADNIQINLGTPLQLVDAGTCATGVLPGSTCTFTVGARPTENKDYPSSIFISSSTLGLNQSTLNNILIVGKRKPVLVFNNSKYLFNDGASSGIITRVITITNQGPSVSQATQIIVDSPYSIVSNTCPSSIGVQQSCQVTVSVNRSSSLGAGYKNITINNEVENATAQSTLGYAELQFSQDSNTTKRYYCVGPYNVQALGQDGVLKNLASATTITLDSTTQHVLFYSESTCNNKISSITIASNTNTSAQFYLRSITSETNTITGSFGALPQAQRSFFFQDIKTDLLAFKPAIAVKNMGCIMCHASVKGNIVTDMGFSNNQGEFFGLGSPGSGNEIDTTGFSGGSWGGVDKSFGTSYIQGTIFIPKLTFTPSAKSYLESMVVSGKSPVSVSNGSGGMSTQTLYKSTVSTTFNTVADYINSAWINRTSSYLSFLLNWGSGLFAKDPTISPTSLFVREVPSVNISWPAASKITSFLDNPGTFKYYKWDDAGADLTNFGEVPGKYFGNLDKSTVMICDGDIFVDGIVVLNELKIQTNTGCRIYATKSVFIQAPNSSVANRQGIEYQGTSTGANVEISSSKGILMGLGQCPNVSTYYIDYATAKGPAYSQKYGMIGYRATYKDYSELGALMIDLIPDYDKVTDSSGNGILYDAAGPVGGCAPITNSTYANNRKVDFQHLLLNAPRIDSRYTGNFKGIIIGGGGIWSLGSFKYSYDSTFDTSPILPFFSPEVFFSVQDCVVNGIDQATSKDTNYKSCP